MKATITTTVFFMIIIMGGCTKKEPTEIFYLESETEEGQGMGIDTLDYYGVLSQHYVISNPPDIIGLSFGL